MIRHILGKEIGKRYCTPNKLYMNYLQKLYHESQNSLSYQIFLGNSKRCCSQGFKIEEILEIYKEIANAIVHRRNYL